MAITNCADIFLSSNFNISRYENYESTRYFNFDHTTCLQCKQKCKKFHNKHDVLLHTILTLSNRSAWGEWRGPWEVSRGLASCWPAWSLYSSDSTTCYPRSVSPACSTSRYNPPAALRSYVLSWSDNWGTTYFVIIESKDQASVSFKKIDCCSVSSSTNAVMIL